MVSGEHLHTLKCEETKYPQLKTQNIKSATDISFRSNSLKYFLKLNKFGSDTISKGYFKKVEYDSQKTY